MLEMLNMAAYIAGSQMRHRDVAAIKFLMQRSLRVRNTHLVDYHKACAKIVHLRLQDVFLRCLIKISEQNFMRAFGNMKMCR